jgi:hypothetical protein
MLLLAALLLAAEVGPAMAARGDGRPGPRQNHSLSADRAAESARRQTGGRVLNVRPASGGHQVKVLTPSGEVRYVFVPEGDR